MQLSATNLTMGSVLLSTLLLSPQPTLAADRPLSVLAGSSLQLTLTLPRATFEDMPQLEWVQAMGPDVWVRARVPLEAPPPPSEGALPSTVTLQQNYQLPTLTSAGGWQARVVTAASATPLLVQDFWVQPSNPGPALNIMPENQPLVGGAEVAILLQLSEPPAAPPAPWVGELRWSARLAELPMAGGSATPLLPSCLSSSAQLASSGSQPITLDAKGQARLQISLPTPAGCKPSELPPRQLQLSASFGAPLWAQAQWEGQHWPQLSTQAAQARPTGELTSSGQPWELQLAQLHAYGEEHPLPSASWQLRLAQAQFDWRYSDENWQPRRRAAGQMVQQGRLPSGRNVANWRWSLRAGDYVWQLGGERARWLPLLVRYQPPASPELQLSVTPAAPATPQSTATMPLPNSSCRLLSAGSQATATSLWPLAWWAAAAPLGAAPNQADTDELGINPSLLQALLQRHLLVSAQNNRVPQLPAWRQLWLAQLWEAWGQRALSPLQHAMLHEILREGWGPEGAAWLARLSPLPPAAASALANLQNPPAAAGAVAQAVARLLGSVDGRGLAVADNGAALGPNAATAQLGTPPLLTTALWAQAVLAPPLVQWANGPNRRLQNLPLPTMLDSAQPLTLRGSAVGCEAEKTEPKN